jgi:hypothetical protein
MSWRTLVIVIGMALVIGLGIGCSLGLDCTSAPFVSDDGNSKN